ncbi:MAG: SusC/RagA family TonB-linked outer membrane protein, partial [Bacteroidetes bacterium]|nr:SusC/RagA family TonB-linked outer membrane protein [Bacteroidota bacterium]
MKWAVRNSPTFNTLYQTRDRRLTTAAVGEVYTNDLTKTASASFGGMLTGRLAGLQVTQSTGEPGNDDPNLYVRGQAPLVMVDGTPQSFVSLNPEQIESITVLKDALSTAMLGMRASGGVILITTKKGLKQGQSIQFTAQQGIQQPTRMLKPLNAWQYAGLYNEALANEGRPALYTQSDLDAWKNNTDPYGHPDVDWQKQILKNQAAYSRYDLSFAGAAKNARYFANLDYMLQDGLFKTEDFNVYNTNADYKRYIFRSNVEIDLSKWVSTSLNLFGRIQNTNQPGATTATIFSNLLSTPNNAYPVRNADNSLGGNLLYQDNLYGQTVLTGYRPIYERDFKADFSIKGNLDRITKGLWIKGLAAINAYQRETIDRSKTFAVYSRATDTTGGKPLYNQFGTNGSQNNSDAINAQNRLAYMEVSMGWAKTMGSHTLNVLALASNDYRMINSNLPFSFSGIAAKVSYDYQQKYIAEVTAGYNGAELYPQSKRYGFFPAVGLGWNISEENFLKNKFSWLNALKLRASYGKTGNANAGYYQYNQYYTTGTGYGFGS